MISLETQQKLLDIKEKVQISQNEMADKLNITFFPYDEKAVGENILNFKRKLEESFLRLNVNVIPYKDSLHRIRLSKVLMRVIKILLNNFLFVVESIYKTPERIFVNWGVLVNTFKRTRIKKGISVVALGENTSWNLPMDTTSSFTESSVITILDLPSNIKDDSSFYEHFDTAMGLFAYHMTNIVIAVKEDKWILYNFNASHPTYPIEDNIDKYVLKGLIPKIVAPIRPVKFDEFTVKNEVFDPMDEHHKYAVKDMLESGNLLEKSGLYPQGKKIDSLPFRNGYYRWIGKIHLDNRNGMSYGFLARQLPTVLSSLIPLEQAKGQFGEAIQPDKDYFEYEKSLYLIIDLPTGTFAMKVPEVWVLSQRSGCNKTKMDPERDLIKLGLVSGKLYLQSSKKVKLNQNYKTSFDTKLILANALGNTIIASILKHFQKDSEFAKLVESNGLAICHWHGYINEKSLPKNFLVHGNQNPNVSCSSPQSAIYALDGKLRAFIESMGGGNDFAGDIHVEPHHGTNIIFPSLQQFGEYIVNNPDTSTLGNKYLQADK